LSQVRPRARAVVSPAVRLLTDCARHALQTTAGLPHPTDVPEHQMAPTPKTGASSAVSPATGGSVPPSSSESGASLPPASGHTSAGKSAQKAHRQDLANLVKIWYAHVRAGQPDYFNKELWGRKKKWQPVWKKLREEITSAGGANWKELRRLLAAINGEYDGDSAKVTRTCTQVLSDVVHKENDRLGPYKPGSEPFRDSISPAGTLPGTPLAAGNSASGNDMETDGSDDVLVSDSDGSDEEEPTVTLTGFLEENGVTTYASSAAELKAIEKEKQKLLKKAKFGAIMQKFNFNEDGFVTGTATNVGDGKRLQAPIRRNTNLATLLFKKFKSMPFGKNTTPGTFVFLGREKGCEEQCRHRDAKHGAFFIYALSDDYTVRVWDGTHLPEDETLERMDGMINQTAPDVETSEGRLLTLKKGEMAIVHARAIHAGGPASKNKEPATDRFQDLAIHGFIDEFEAPARDENVTYPVCDKQLELALGSDGSESVVKPMTELDIDVCQQHAARIEEEIMAAVNEKKPKFKAASDKKKKVSHQARIGRSLSHASKPPKGQEQYYAEHNMRKDKMVFIGDNKTKPEWLKDLYKDHLTPLICKAAEDWAGKDGDWAVQLLVYKDGDYCEEHVDKEDIDVQYMLCLGSYTGGELRVRVGDDTHDVDLNHKLVKVDARNPHSVLPFEGTRISVIWYKVFDTRMKTKAPVTDTIATIWSAPEAPSPDPMEVEEGEQGEPEGDEEGESEGDEEGESEGDEEGESEGDEEPTRDDLKSDLRNHAHTQPDDESGKEFTDWKQDHEQRAAELVEKFGRPQDSAYLLWYVDDDLGTQISIANYFRQKWKVVENKWSNKGTDKYGRSMDYRLKQLTGTSARDCDSFAKWLALAIYRDDQSLSSFNGTKAKCDGAYELLLPQTGFFRVDTDFNGHCEYIENIPILILTKKGIEPHRRNGPVDVLGDYGRDDCVLVAINGACGYTVLTREQLAAIQPLFASGGLSLYDDCLRDIVNKTAFKMERRTKLFNSYKVFLETSGIYVVATKLICADGTEQLHAIYLDCERDVVHFGYNDYGDDMISFLIEKPDRRDTTSAEENLISPKNFPRNTENPGRSLVKIEIREVVQIMVKTKKIKSIPHVAYTFAASKRPLEETADASNKRSRN
jgi:hypothetical protein